MRSSGIEFDVFISYNWLDHSSAEVVGRALRERGLDVFLDRWYLMPGRSWTDALEDTITGCRAVAVILGPRGMGRWQQREINLALYRQTRNPDFPVIPVLLSGADPPLGFLAQNTWVDLKAGLDDPYSLEILTAAVRGEPPGPDLRDRIGVTLSGICPYRGLRYFREEDSPFFYGRDSFAERLAGKVGRKNLLAVVGASGSGKSSVVRAGLLPRLRRVGGHIVWDIATMVPTDRPLRRLAAVLIGLLEEEMTETDRMKEIGKMADGLAEGGIPLRDVADRVLEKQPGTDRLLLVVDQWEELYTLTRDENERGRFMDELLEATAAGRLSVVLTLRGDFFGHLLQNRALADRLQGSVENLGPMTREELKQAIEGPARKAGLEFDPGLVERILEDAGETAGYLPLLEFVLYGLWEERRSGRLLHEAYEAMGGLKGAAARRAEQVYGGLDDQDRRTARYIFSRLVRIGEGTEDTRQRAALSELGEAAGPVVKRLADARLLVTGFHESVGGDTFAGAVYKGAIDETAAVEIIGKAAGDETVEVAHEALIRNWKRLNDWIDEDREFLLWRQRLKINLDDWERLGRDEDVLLRGAQLAEAGRWLTERQDDLNRAELDFIKRSIELKEQERASQERRRRRLTFVSIGASIVFLIVAAVAVMKWREAERQGRLLFANKLAALSTAFKENRLDLALLLGVEACSTAATVEARSSLLSGLQYGRGIMSFLHGHGSAERSVAFSPNGSVLASGGWDNKIILWDVDVGSWKARACRIANRNMTGREWRQYIGTEIPRRRTCPDIYDPKD